MKYQITNLQSVRQAVADQMRENGGGLLPETLESAANKIGCSHVSLRAFLREGAGLSTDLAIKLAAYLSILPSVVVAAAGHPDAARILAAYEVPARQAAARASRILVE